MWVPKITGFNNGWEASSCTSIDVDIILLNLVINCILIPKKEEKKTDISVQKSIHIKNFFFKKKGIIFVVNSFFVLNILLVELNFFQVSTEKFLGKRNLKKQKRQKEEKNREVE